MYSKANLIVTISPPFHYHFLGHQFQSLIPGFFYATAWLFMFAEFFSGITFNLMYLQCCCKARDKTGGRGGGGVQDSLFATASKHRLAYFHTCVLHGQSTSSHPIPISPCEPHLIIADYLKPDTHTLTHTQWFLKKNIRAFFSNFCNSFSVNHCGVHARRVRLPEMRLPLIKILVWGRAAFNVTQDIHALLQGQHAVAPSKLLHNHTAKSRLHFNVHFYGWTVPAFYLM